jgi:hypothetical protein
VYAVDQFGGCRDGCPIIQSNLIGNCNRPRIPSGASCRSILASTLQRRVLPRFRRRALLEEHTVEGHTHLAGHSQLQRDASVCIHGSNPRPPTHPDRSPSHASRRRPRDTNRVAPFYLLLRMI